MYLCIRGIDFAYFYDLSIWFQNFFDSVQLFFFFILLRMGNIRQVWGYQVIRSRTSMKRQGKTKKTLGRQVSEQLFVGIRVNKQSYCHCQAGPLLILIPTNNCSETCAHATDRAHDQFHVPNLSVYPKHQKIRVERQRPL
jgi:hypothetical protein